MWQRALQRASRFLHGPTAAAYQAGRAAEAAERAAAVAEEAVSWGQAAVTTAQDATGEARASREAVERLAAEWAADRGPEQRIKLDYPVAPRPRFGHGHPSHPPLSGIIAAGEDRYRRRLGHIEAVRSDLHRLPLTDGSSPEEPVWANPWLPGLDVAALYAIVAHDRPSLYLEVGSGMSTKVVRRAVRDHDLPTRIVSIDPQPRAEVDALCDEVVRSPLEDCDLAVFDRVGAGDIVFVDNSHRVFTNSDATVVFLEVLPALAAGALVQVHDIFLPDDYPSAWRDRYYSEQYVLAALLLGGGGGFSTDFPAWYVATHPDLAERLKPLFEPLEGVERHGGSYWLRKDGSPSGPPG